MIVKIKGSDGATYYRLAIKQSDGAISYAPLPSGVTAFKEVKLLCDPVGDLQQLRASEGRLTGRCFMQDPIPSIDPEAR